MDRRTQVIVDAVKKWADGEKENNPSFSLLIGRKAFTIDQIVEHVEKQTEDGEKLMDMIVNAGAALFLPTTRPH